MSATAMQVGNHTIREYEELKMEASRQAARYLQELDSVNREQKFDQDRLDNELRRKGELENKHRQKGHERNETMKRVEKLNEQIRSSEEVLEEQRRLRNELQADGGSCLSRANELQAALEDVAAQLGDARVDKHEKARRRKKQEIVDNFKREIPGVYDRMINMCQPTHKRYNVAITKVLGKYMEAIVVDTEKTARRCIQVLKERMLEPETFLPLDYIQAKPLKKRLRDIREPKNVKLLFDVLRFEPPAIHRAVLFVTNNALVCETPEDASRVAYDLYRSKNSCYDAVALDGTFYQKSGIISGGDLDLTRKAKRWDEKHLSQLKAKKEKLTEELRESMKKLRKEFELTTVDAQIAARVLEARLKYAQSDRDSALKQIKQLDAEVAGLERAMDTFGPQISGIERTMAARDARIQELKENMNNVENNIRQYEERELRAQQERAKRRMEFEAQIDLIASILEFERSRDTQSVADRASFSDTGVAEALRRRCSLRLDAGRTHRLRPASSLSELSRTTLAPDTYRCDHCDKAFRHKSVLSEHIHTHTSTRPAQSRYSTREDCNLDQKKKLDTSLKGNLQKDESTLTREKTFKCSYCDYECNRKGNLRRHEMRHTGVKPYQCNNCDYKCNQKTSLRYHVMKHTGVKSFQCNYCDYTCTRKAYFRIHEMTHTGVKPYQCSYCDYKCIQKESLRTHEMKHTGEKPFQCNYCDYKCIRKGHFRIHEMTHTGIKPYQCSYCDYKCIEKRSLRTHEMIHTGVKPFQCNYCDYKCREKRHLRTHEMKHTGVKPYQCNYCDYKCRRNNQLRSHKRTHTRGENGVVR